MSFSMPRTRRSDSLAAAVTELLDDFQCPVSTTAIRVILNDRGRPVTAEQLGRLAAYQREDFLRTRIPPQLTWTLQPDGAPTKPRWWTRGDWRLNRRILTDDVKRRWFAHLAEWLCLDLAEQPDHRDPAIVTLTLAAIAQTTDKRVFDVPTTSDEWKALRAEVYGCHLGVFSNMTGPTEQQHEAEASLEAAGLSGFERLFGREAS